MKILSLHNDIDAGCCLIDGKNIIETLNEERFNRKKLYKGFPKKTLEYILNKYSLTPNKIDYVIYGWHGKNLDLGKYKKKLVSRIIHAMKNNSNCGDLISDRINIEINRDQNTRQIFEKNIIKYGFKKKQILYLEHHLSHAWSAYAASPFKSAYIFTFDGRGDFKSATANYFDKKLGIVPINFQLTFDSLGYLYSQITKFLGFKAFRHEGKITGLAAFGDFTKTIKIFEKAITFKDGNFITNLGYFNPFTNCSKEMSKDLKSFNKEDVAAGVQKVCEKLIVKYINYWMKKSNYKSSNVCLAGGVAGNVRINQIIHEQKKIRNLFVFPHMGDGGIPLGAACYANFELNKIPKVNFKTARLGVEYSNRQILGILKKYETKLNIKHVGKRLAEFASNDLQDNQVIGWFQGKMEYGPRALGSRSILFHAQDPSCNDWLNKRMNRTEFMPFGPVTTEKLAKFCFKNYNKNDLCTPFMTKTFNCTSTFKKTHPAVVHLDGTSRPQVIFRKENPNYYDLITDYHKKTGQFALINTSFNAHEEPIVFSPKDAVLGLLNKMIDILYIGSYRVAKLN